MIVGYTIKDLKEKYSRRQFSSSFQILHFLPGVTIYFYLIRTYNLSLESNSRFPRQETSHLWTPKFHNLLHQLAVKRFEVHIQIKCCMPLPSHPHRLNQFTSDNLYDITEDQS